MMSPKAIASLVCKMQAPIGLLNREAVMRWRLEKAAEIAMKTTIDEIFNKTTQWRQ